MAIDNRQMKLRADSPGSFRYGAPAPGLFTREKCLRFKLVVQNNAFYRATLLQIRSSLLVQIRPVEKRIVAQVPTVLRTRPSRTAALRTPRGDEAVPGQSGCKRAFAGRSCRRKGTDANEPLLYQRAQVHLAQSSACSPYTPRPRSLCVNHPKTANLVQSRQLRRPNVIFPIRCDVIRSRRFWPKSFWCFSPGALARSLLRS